MASSVWDDERLAPASGSYVKFDNIGDGISGVVTAVGIKSWDDGTFCPQLEVTTDAGDERTLTAGATRLKAAIVEHRPEVGDHIDVYFVSELPLGGGRKLKVFDVEVKRGEVADAVGTDVDKKKSDAPF